MPLPKPTEPPTVPHAPQNPSAAGPRRTCARCIPGACACLVLGMGKQETSRCLNPPLFWEERTGGGKAWPGLPVTLQNSFKAQRELGECVAVWLQNPGPFLPESCDIQRQRRAQPAATCQGWELARHPPVKHSLRPNQPQPFLETMSQTSTSFKKKIEKKGQKSIFIFPRAF